MGIDVRFQRLHVPAFGPFTNLDLRFSDQPCDLHVIYGANEAGKSSLLRAIRDLLFGIHGQSPDNFLHDYAALRIRGEVVNRAGEQLVFQRRKGIKNTLLDATNNPLADDALLPFLGGVDQSYFSAMFGLGARELREGAQQLLRGEGDLGHALFSASMGGTPIEKVLEALAAQADQLFKGRATANVSIRPAANRYKELLGNSRDAMVRPEAWEQVEQGLVDANDRKQTLDDEIGALERDLAWISRCEDALPTVGKLIGETQSLEQLPPLPDLASDFVTRARAARQAATNARDEVQRLTQQMERLQNQRQALQTSPAVLAEEDALDQLHRDLGAFAERKQSLANLKTKLDGLEPLLCAGMKSLQLTGEFASLETHRLSSPVRLACEEAARALTGALANVEENTTKTADFEKQINEREDGLRNLPETDLTSLREALAVAAGATAADKDFAANELQVNNLTREAAAQHQRLLGAPQDLDATARLPVPAIATIRRYQEKMDGIARAIEAEQDEIDDANKRHEAIQAELERLQRQGELPTEDALRKAREHRDRGWKLVLADWKGPGVNEEFVPETPLEEAFPRAIVKADEIADRLRKQAESVAQAEEKRFQLSQCEKQVREAEKEIEELQAAANACQKSWVHEWSACGITPRSPAEMTEWRAEWHEFTQALDRLRAAEESLAVKTRQIQAAKQKFAAVLGDSETKEFSVLFEAARSRVQAGEESAGSRRVIRTQRDDLKRELADVEEDRPSLTTAVTVAMKQWKAQCRAAGLPEETSPDAGLALLGERKELLAKFDQWQELSGQARSAAEAIQQYDQAVEAKARMLAIKGDITEVLESALWKALTAARKAQTQHEQFTRQIGEAKDELEAAKLVAEQANQSLIHLTQLAKLAALNDLEPLLANLEKRDSARKRIHELRETLGGLARGQAVDDFIARVRGEDAEMLPERKARAERDKAKKQSPLAEVTKTLFELGGQKTELEKAGDDAANFRQQAEACAASLRRDAARFTRLRLAMHLLQNQIERFRKENQGPLLAKSGAVFNKITSGAFSGLGAEFNADDVPVLVGLRPDDSKVSIDGMSDGSRDQLFLALRLAALDRYLEEHEPMPLILDDLLMTFDNDRAKAILPQLRALAQRTQIFLFTHHEHLVELCRQTVGINQFHLHRLGNAA
jgi:uncharacterized protein YhaN